KRWAGRDPKELGRGSGVRDGGCPEPDPDHRQQGGGCFQHQREDRRLRTKRTPAAAIPIPTATPRSARPGPLPVASATAVARLGLEPDASPSVAAVPALVSADVPVLPPADVPALAFLTSGAPSAGAVAMRVRICPSEPVSAARTPSGSSPGWATGALELARPE